MAIDTSTPSETPRVLGLSLSGAETKQALEDVERQSRLLEAKAIELAHYIAVNSRKDLPKEENLANQAGYRNAVDFLESVTHISSAEARRRIALGAKTQPRQFMGQVLDPEYPKVATALNDATVPADSALAIIRMLEASAKNKVIPEKIAIAEEALVEDATNACFDALKDQINAWHSYIDPDGLEPREDRAFRKRSLRFGHEVNGLTEIIIMAPTIDAARIKAAFAEADQLTTKPRFLSKEEQAEQDAAPEMVTGPHGEQYAKFRDPRSRSQRWYDLMFGYFNVGLRAKDLGENGARSLATVNVTITAKDLENGIGVGWVEGLGGGISVAEVKRIMDSEGGHPVFFGKNGAIKAYGDRQRGFTEKQRRAIVARDGAFCSCGCGLPAAACEIHHIIVWARGGLTEVDNGILVCRPFHRWLPESGFEIAMINGKPHLLAPPHVDPSQTWRPMGQNRGQIRDQLDGIGF